MIGATSSFGNGNSDIYMVKVDEDLEYQWSKAIGTGQVEWGNSIEPIDGGYIIAGFTNGAGAGGYDIYLLKTDSLGNLLWNKTYGGTGWDFANCVTPTPDGGFLVVGETYSFGAGGTDLIALKMDSVGNLEWQKTYGDTGDDVGHGAIVTYDSTYAIVGATTRSNDSTDGWLLRLDQNGDTLWTETYGGVGNELFYNVIQYSVDSTFAMVGYTTTNSTSGDKNIYFTKSDQSGIQQFEHVTLNNTSGSNHDDVGVDLRELPSGWFLVTGYTETFGAGMKDFYAYFADPGGWWTSNASSIGGLEDDELFATAISVTGQIVIAGSTTSYGDGGSDILVTKFDSISPVTTIEVLNFLDETAGTVTVAPLLSYDHEVEMNLYPNPFTGSFYLDLKGPVSNEDLSIEVYDMTGRRVYVQSLPALSHHEININGLSPGIYSVVIQNSSTPLGKGLIVAK